MPITTRKPAAPIAPEPEITTPATVLDVSQIVVLLTSVLSEQRQLSVRLSNLEVAQSASDTAHATLAADLRSEPGIGTVAAGMVETGARKTAELVQRVERLDATVRDLAAYTERLGFSVHEVSEIVRANTSGSARAVADQIVHEIEKKLASTNVLLTQATAAIRQEAESTRKAVRQAAA